MGCLVVTRMFLSISRFPTRTIKRSHFAGGDLTPPLTKGDARPLWKSHLIVPASRGGVYSESLGIKPARRFGLHSESAGSKKPRRRESRPAPAIHIPTEGSRTNRNPTSSSDYSRSEEESRHCVNRGVSLEERRHRDEKFQCRVWRSARCSNFFRPSVLQTQPGGRTKAQAHCLRSGGLTPRLLSRALNDAG